MQELRLVLIIVGALAITALLFHGLWTSRKEKPAKFGEKPLGKIEEAPLEIQDDAEESVSEARVVNTPKEVVEKTKSTKRKEPGFSFGERPQHDPLLGDIELDDSDDDLPKMSAKDSDDVPTKAAPQPAQAQVVKPPVQPQSVVTPTAPVEPAQQSVQQPQPQVAPTMVAEPVVEASAPIAETVAQPAPVQASQQPEVAPAQAPIQQPVITEPVVQQEQLVVAETPVAIEPEVVAQPIEKSVVESQPQFVPAEEPVKVEEVAPVVEEVATVAASEPEVVEPVKTKQEPSFTFMSEPEPEPEPLPPSYISLCVHARSGKILRGPSLFACLERHGLIFGENSVFHRHADLAGTEPVIFSVTNLLNPGSFPETNYQHFETPGIGFFLMLPCHGKASSNFNLMLQTAQQIADELNADVLDQDRVMITPNRIAQYRDKSVKYNNA
ncbi:cell division protein ZipA [Photobacterium leiognathi]|uniref:cell division protein ZipA n=1 Tax=Photobacterium leiognathi TaxID=553611 RepID=UPI002980CDA9|nr:cell division protein ZipA [Photobacterium leiognathi]